MSLNSDHSLLEHFVTSILYLNHMPLGQHLTVTYQLSAALVVKMNSASPQGSQHVQLSQLVPL